MEQRRERKCGGIYLLILVAGLFLGGCATSKGSLNLVTAPKEPARIEQYADLGVEVSCAEGVVLSETDTERLKWLIVANVKKEQPERFKTINKAEQKETMLLASVKIKDYDKGNAFARLMLAGLGQIYIGSEVVLKDGATMETLCAFEVDKRFAWGRGSTARSRG